MFLNGLGRLGATWNTLPDPVIDWTRDSIRRLVGTMGPKQLSATVISLGKLGWRWEGLGERQRRALLRSIPRSMTDGAACGEIANLANGLGVMGVVWHTLPRSVLSAFASGINRVGRWGSPSELASTLYGIALMECQWKNQFDANLQSILVEGIVRAAGEPDTSPHTVANLVYSLSLLSFDVEDLELQQQLFPAYIALLDSIDRGGISRFSEKEREQLLMFVHLLRSVTPCKEQAEMMRPIFRVAKRSTVYHLYKCFKTTSPRKRICMCVFSVFRRWYEY